jgi:hypothetical protein
MGISQSHIDRFPQLLRELHVILIRQSDLPFSQPALCLKVHVIKGMTVVKGMLQHSIDARMPIRLSDWQRLNPEIILT